MNEIGKLTVKRNFSASFFQCYLQMSDDNFRDRLDSNHQSLIRDEIISFEFEKQIYAEIKVRNESSRKKRLDQEFRRLSLPINKQTTVQ